MKIIKLYDNKLGLVIKELEFGYDVVNGVFDRFSEWASPNSEILFELSDEKVEKMCKDRNMEKRAMEYLIFMDFKLNNLQSKLETLADKVSNLQFIDGNRYQYPD